MSSRREEKEARRQERIEAEQAAARVAKRKRMLGLGVAGVLGAAAVAAVVVVVVFGGGSGPGGTTTPTVPGVPIPPQRSTDLRASARAAGCQLRSFAPGPRDREHTRGPDIQVTYKQNPPVFGPHAPPPYWASDGSYVGRPTPPKEHLVHSLEHGRILIQYKPGLDQRRIGQLQTLWAEPAKPGLRRGYNTLLLQNNTNMAPVVAATGWGQQLLCPAFNDKIFDAIRTFRTTYVDKAPEFIPQPE